MIDYELQSHKKSDKIKWILTAIAFVLVVVMLVGICMQIFVKDDKFKPSNWFMETEELPNKADNDQNGATSDTNSGNMIVSEIVENGIKLLSTAIPVSEYEENGIMPTADSAVLITAKVLPEYAIDKTVDFSMYFDPDCGEPTAAGQEVPVHYATLTQTEDGALTATLVCKNAFPYRIVVCVTSRNNPEAKAYATFDYRKKVMNVKYNLSGFQITNTTNNQIEWTLPEAFSDNWFEIGKFTDIYSLGTIEDPVVSHSIVLQHSTSFKTELYKVFPNQEYNSVSFNNEFTCDGDFTTYLNPGMLFGYNNGSSKVSGIFSFAVESYNSTSFIPNSYINDLISAILSSPSEFTITIKAVTESGAECSIVYRVNIDNGSPFFNVQGMEIEGDNNYVF